MKNVCDICKRPPSAFKALNNEIGYWFILDELGELAHLVLDECDELDYRFKIAFTKEIDDSYRIMCSKCVDNVYPVYKTPDGKIDLE